MFLPNRPSHLTLHGFGVVELTLVPSNNDNDLVFNYFYCWIKTKLMVIGLSSVYSDDCCILMYLFVLKDQRVSFRAI